MVTLAKYIFCTKFNKLVSKIVYLFHEFIGQEIFNLQGFGPDIIHNNYTSNNVRVFKMVELNIFCTLAGVCLLLVMTQK